MIFFLFGVVHMAAESGGSSLCVFAIYEAHTRTRRFLETKAWLRDFIEKLFFRIIV